MAALSGVAAKVVPTERKQSQELGKAPEEHAIARFVDLSDPKILANYLDPQFQHLAQLGARVAQTIYECPSREIKRNVYGNTFPMEPEILAYAMQLAKDQIAVEIAGASGENSALLAFAGAQKVYMNDLEPSEMASFRHLRDSLPPAISERLEPAEGDCFDLLEKHPQLANKVGLVLCRNLIHFLDDEKQAALFDLTKKMLKPGGRAIFTANSIYPLDCKSDREALKKDPETTTFTTTQCLITDRVQSTLPCAIPYIHLAPCSGPPQFGYKDLYLYEKNLSTGYKWRVDNDAFRQVDVALQPKIQEAVQAHKELMKSIQAGSVRVLTNTLRLYTLHTLPALFMRHGFEVEAAYVVDEKGHLLPKEDIERRGKQMGVIVRYQPEPLV